MKDANEARGQCTLVERGSEPTRSSRLHDLIPICQQGRNPLKSAITARTENSPDCVRTASGSMQLPEGCVPPGRFGLPAAKPSRGIGWYGRIASPNNAACAAKSAKSSQLCGDANYSRVHAEGEPPLHTTALPTAPQSSILRSRNTKGRNGIVEILDRQVEETRAMLTMIGEALLHPT